MSDRSIRAAVVLSLLLMGCAGEMESQAPPLPPPPPQTAPPPELPTLAPSAAVSASPPPAPTASTSSQSQTGPLPPLPSQAPQYTATPEGPVATSDLPPPATQWVQSYPDGQWVYSADYGWIWVPAGATAVGTESVPYAYLYTPAYGWTWYVSPWGFGAYHYGIWVRHAWHPVGWHGGWVAHPRVVVRLGGHGGYHGGGYRGGHGHRR